MIEVLHKTRNRVSQESFSSQSQCWYRGIRASDLWVQGILRIIHPLFWDVSGPVYLGGPLTQQKALFKVSIHTTHFAEKLIINDRVLKHR